MGDHGEACAVYLAGLRNPVGKSISELLKALQDAHHRFAQICETFGAEYPGGEKDQILRNIKAASLGVWEAKFMLGLDKIGKTDRVKLRKFAEISEKESINKKLLGSNNSMSQTVPCHRFLVFQ